MPAPSLYELAKGRLIQNVHLLEDVGDLPYAFLSPILRRLENPNQLQELETNCPQLFGETGEVWRKFILRDFPERAQQPHEPRDPKNWSKVYRKFKRDAEREEEEQKEKLRKTMQNIQKDRQGHQTTIIEGRTGYQPSMRRKGFAFGSGSGLGRAAPPKATGRVAFDKLKRGIFDHQQNRPKAAMMPAHVLAQRKRTVAEAPAHMIRQKQHEAQASRIVVSKGAAASISNRSLAAVASIGRPPPSITTRPIVRPGPAPLGQAARPRLPEGQQFSAPKISSPRTTTTPRGPKRRREEPSILRQPKRPRT